MQSSFELQFVTKCCKSSLPLSFSIQSNVVRRNLWWRFGIRKLCLELFIWFVLIYVQIVLYLYKSSLAILYFHLYFVLLKSPCPSVGVPQFLPHLKHMHTYLMLTGGPFTSGVFIFVLQPFCTSFFSFSLHILFSLQVLCSFTIHCPLFITQMTNVHILPATYNFPNFSFFSFQSNYFFNDNFSFFVLTLICTNIN